LACKLMSDAKTSYEPATTFGGTRALLSRDGKLWFATSEGLLNVDARQPDMDSSTLLLPLYLESAAFNGKRPISLLRTAPWSATASKNKPIVVRGDLLSLDIHFTALSFST